MICSVVRKLLPLHSGADLPQFLAERLNRHLHHCYGCARELQDLVAALADAKKWAGQVQCPVDFAAEARKAIDVADPGPFSTGQPYWHKVALGVVALLIAVSVIVSRYQVFDLREKDSAGDRPAIADARANKHGEAFLIELLSQINADPDLTDAGLNAKYPLVESIEHPLGTHVIYHTGDPRIRIVWIVSQKGNG